MLKSELKESDVLAVLQRHTASNQNIDFINLDEYYDNNDEYYTLVHLACKNDHAEMLSYLIDNYPKYLIKRDKNKYLPLEIALEENAQKCLLKFNALSIKNKELMLGVKYYYRNIDEIIDILQLGHNELINCCNLLTLSDCTKDALTKRQKKYFEEMLEAVLNIDIYKVTEYIHKGFNLDSDDGNSILMQIILSREKTEKRLKMIAFLISKNVSYRYEDVESNLSTEEKVQVREYVCIFLSGNVNEKLITNLFFFRTNHCGATTKNTIFKIYEDLYGRSSEQSDAYIVKYLRPIMDVIAIHPITFSHGIMKAIAFPVDGAVNGLADLSQKKVYFSIYTDKEDIINLANTKGTIIHEFCHMASYIVYNNQGIPCLPTDGVTKTEYTNVLSQLKQSLEDKVEINEIIKFVFNEKSYPTLDNKLAELIVRVPHILATYGEDGIKILNKLKSTKKLLELYETMFLKDCKEFLDRMCRNPADSLFLKANTLIAKQQFILAIEILNEALNTVTEEMNKVNEENMREYLLNMIICIDRKKSVCQRLKSDFTDEINLQTKTVGGYRAAFFSLFEKAVKLKKENNIESSKNAIQQAYMYMKKCVIPDEFIDPDALAEFLLFRSETLLSLDSLEGLYQIKHIDHQNKYKFKAKTLAIKIFKTYFSPEDEWPQNANISALSRPYVYSPNSQAYFIPYYTQQQLMTPYISNNVVQQHQSESILHTPSHGWLSTTNRLVSSPMVPTAHIQHYYTPPPTTTIIYTTHSRYPSVSGNLSP